MSTVTMRALDADSHKVSIITCFLLVPGLLAILGRLSVKYSITRKFHIDDLFAIMALVFDFASGIAVFVQAAHGLGQPLDLLSSHELHTQLKSGYAAQIFYLATLTAAKLSIVFFLRSLTPDEGHHSVAFGIGGFIVLLWVTEEFGAVFQCHTPETWNSIGNVCFDRASFWYTVGTFNIITDLCLILFPIYIIKDVQMSTHKKIIVLSCFGSRLADIVATGAQLAYTSTFKSPDPSLSGWSWVLITQLVQCITLITSCIPYLRPLLDAFPSGMYQADELRRRGLSSSAVTSKGSARANQNHISSYILKDVSGSGSSRPSAANSDSKWAGTSSVSATVSGGTGGRRNLLKAEAVRKLAVFPGSGKSGWMDDSGKRSGASEEALVGDGAEGGITKSVRVDVENNLEEMGTISGSH